MIDVKKGLIENIEFYGDFLSNGELTSFEESLKTTEYCYESLCSVLSTIDFNALFGSDLTVEEFARFLYNF